MKRTAAEREVMPDDKREMYEARTEEFLLPLVAQHHFELVDVEYVKEGGVPLHMEILTPFTRNKQEGVYPCVVFVQGSAWMKQDVLEHIPLYAHLAERGYIVAIVEYRHSGIAPYPAQAVDARNAIRYIKVHAEELHVDPDKMILAGDSSGGHTAMFGGLRHNDDSDENRFPGISAEVSGIINYYGSVSVLLKMQIPLR